MKFKKALSAFILLCLVFSLLPGSGLALDLPELRVVNMPDDVIGVTVRTGGADYACVKSGSDWVYSEAGKTFNVDAFQLIVTWDTVGGPVTVTYVSNYTVVIMGDNTISLNDWTLGCIEIDNDYSACTPPPGTVDRFEIYDSNGLLIRSVEVPANSTASVDYLIPGTYDLVDWPDDPHYMADNSWRTVTFIEDKIETAQESFSHTAGGVLNITVEVEGEGAPSDASFTFEILNFNTRAFVASVTMPGYSMYLTLPYGRYLVRETDFPAGFKVIGDTEMDVTFSQNSNTADLTFINSYSKPTEIYTVSYHPNGGTGTVPADLNRYYKGDKVRLLSGSGLSKPGSFFGGWELADGTKVSDPFTMPGKDVTLFAVWQTAAIPVVPPKTGDSASLMGFAMIALALAAMGFVVSRKVKV